jgi:hypothetical protein
MTTPETPKYEDIEGNPYYNAGAAEIAPMDSAHTPLDQQGLDPATVAELRSGYTPSPNPRSEV